EMPPPSRRPDRLCLVRRPEPTPAHALRRPPRNRTAFDTLLATLASSRRSVRSILPTTMTPPRACHISVCSVAPTDKPVPTISRYLSAGIHPPLYITPTCLA